MTALDIDWVRSQFPALALKVNGHAAAYFDGPGGTQVPQRVIDAVGRCLASSNANTHGAFATSHRADEVINAAHGAMADLLGCDAEEVVFGPNMTSLTFAISRALARELAPGDEIVVTRLDHDANVSPWAALEERGCVIRWVDIHPEDCTLDMEDLHRKVTPLTRIVAAGYASNSVGTLNDVGEIVRLAHTVGAMAYIDAVHYAPHGPIDVRALDCDFLACSPYKFSLRIRAYSTENANTLNACILTRFGRRPTAFPADGKLERRITKPWQASPQRWNTWRNSGSATRPKSRVGGRQSGKRTTPSTTTNMDYSRTWFPRFCKSPA